MGVTALFIKPSASSWNYHQRLFQLPAPFTAYGSLRNCTRRNRGMAGNHEAGGFMNSAVNLLFSNCFFENCMKINREGHEGLPSNLQLAIKLFMKRTPSVTISISKSYHIKDFAVSNTSDCSYKVSLSHFNKECNEFKNCILFLLPVYQFICHKISGILLISKTKTLQYRNDTVKYTQHLCNSIKLRTLTEVVHLPLSLPVVSVLLL